MREKVVDDVMDAGQVDDALEGDGGRAEESWAEDDAQILGKKQKEEVLIINDFMITPLSAAFETAT